jgi:hypothetical protein
MTQLTRRTMVKGTIALGASMNSRLSAAMVDAVNGTEVLPYTCNTGVTLPPRGRSFLKFSFDFPEPSVEFAGYMFSFRVYTTENTYAMDAAQIRVEKTSSELKLTCNGLTWAGGQEQSPGSVTGHIRKEADGLSFRAAAAVPGRTIKSIAVVVRGVPRGEISQAGARFYQPHEDEVLCSWPDLNAGLASPILVIRSGNQYTSLSLVANPDTARTTRFYLQPGEAWYRAELTYEREAWTNSDHMETPDWHIRSGSSYAAVAQPHYAHVEKAFGVSTWEQRTDVPQWMRDTSLVLSLHGAHWTGYVMNSYAKQLEILRWTATKIEPRRVAVFLPAWDGRYYWNYPIYEPDPRMGGADGFAQLIREGQKLGFHLIPMFGSNVANKWIPATRSLLDSVTMRPGGDLWNLDYVDWDNDRHGEANYGFMNLGVDSWRNHLGARIADMLSRYGADGYFLDIVGCAENNTQGDMSLGTRSLVRTLHEHFPNKLAMGEMHYDALLGSIPVFQADNTAAYPEAYYRYGRMFEHLSWPAPGRGSTGVHEAGFSGRGKLPTADQRVIPTLTVVDDTFERYRSEMQQVIDIAKVWRFPEGS